MQLILILARRFETYRIDDVDAVDVEVVVDDDDDVEVGVDAGADDLVLEVLLGNPAWKPRRHLQAL